ncbi:MAG: GNAT family N-acetyltransferase [Massilioclostridium sp.]|nr:MAG: GNAT family N-acetyltransferase [Massilioclostridium sp.]PWM99597.1 MAG: GNAT family N-acetyltransferase [Massilioclostridium sp.]
MEIKRVYSHKKAFLDLLLLADEQESMIDHYLEQGELFVLYDQGVKTVCVVVKVQERVYEIKNLATDPSFQGKGYGKAMVEYIFQLYQKIADYLLVGTGDSPLTIPFYEKCGFSYSHRVPNFFVDFYDHPIYEAGKQLIDMVYLKKDFVSG